jgi:hypothetical protein
MPDGGGNWTWRAGGTAGGESAEDAGIALGAVAAVWRAANEDVCAMHKTGETNVAATKITFEMRMKYVSCDLGLSQQNS